MTRRDLLRVGTLTWGGLTLANYAQLASAGGVQPGRAERAIFIELPGGASHLDSFDMKPAAAAEIRGSFRPIATNVPGIEICEHLPKLAQVADKFAILRGVSHTSAAHQIGREYVNTGSQPIPALEYPCYGAVVAKERPSDRDIPSHVAIPNAGQGAGFLGIQYAGMETNATPRFGEPFAVRGLTLPAGMAVDQVQQRHKLLRKLDQRLAALEQHSQLLEGLDQFGQQAYSMLTSSRAREAFDISKEDESFAKSFGVDPFGQSCLLALRLVESGVRFASVQLGGWDTHTDNFSKLKQNNLPKLDAGLSGLLNGLEQRGLLATTAVLVTGEFGRTPKINDRGGEGGRDHYPRCMFMLMAGGGVRGGQVIGASDATAAAPLHEAISPADVAASFYYNLGIDPQLEYPSSTGRPITLVRDGKVIQSLFG
jgi:hypothetical protein